MQRQQIGYPSTRRAKLELAQEALHYSNWNNRITMEIFSLESREEIDPLLIQRADNTEKISTLLQKIREQVESEEERELLDAVDATRWPYINSYEQALHALIDEQILAEAREAMVKLTLPLLLNYHDAWNAFVQFQRAEVEFAERTEELAEKVAERTRELTRMNQELANEVAEHKRTEERFSQLASMVESSNDAIIGHTLDGTIVSWNVGAESIYGYSASEVLGRTRNILVPPEQPDEIPTIVERLIRGERTQLYETVRMRKDGQRIDVSMTLSLVKDANGKIAGAWAITRDITQHKKAEERFYKAFNASPEPITIANFSEGRYIDVNESFLRVTGYRRERSLVARPWS